MILFFCCFDFTIVHKIHNCYPIVLKFWGPVEYRPLTMVTKFGNATFKDIQDITTHIKIRYLITNLYFVLCSTLHLQLQHALRSLLYTLSFVSLYSALQLQVQLSDPCSLLQLSSLLCTPCFSLFHTNGEQGLAYRSTALPKCIQYFIVQKATCCFCCWKITNLNGKTIRYPRRMCSNWEIRSITISLTGVRTRDLWRVLATTPMLN